MQEPPARERYKVLGLLVILFAITYLDRVCISVAGPRMQAELGITPAGWGWVTGAFTIAYGLFEMPTGMLGDRLGPRRVLTRIVLWWSAFTALTGSINNYYVLLATRFLFGMGEAGAFPNAAVVVTRWFPASQRGTIQGVTLMAAQIGGALAPLLVVPIQMRYGWRASFFVFAMLGVVWSAVWYRWFRDWPSELHSAAPVPRTHEAFPWRPAFSSASVLAMLGTAFCYFYVLSFYHGWIHTFLVKGRGFSEGFLWLSALPYTLGAGANLAGGAVSDVMVRRLGPRRGRQTLGVTLLTAAGLFLLAAMVLRHPVLTVLALAAAYGAIGFQQSGLAAACLDLSPKNAGALMGLTNTFAQAGALLGSVLFGYIVEATGSYNAPFVPMAALLFLGALLWLKIDTSHEIGLVKAEAKQVGIL